MYKFHYDKIKWAPDNEPSITYIYALVDPRNKNIRYIGKANNPNQRLIQHLRSPLDCLKEWLNELKQENLKPILSKLESTTHDNIAEAEIKWIKTYESEHLLNITHNKFNNPIYLNSTIKELKYELNLYQNKIKELNLLLSNYLGVEDNTNLLDDLKNEIRDNLIKEKISDWFFEEE